MNIFKNNIGKLALINFFSSLYFYLPILTIYYQQRGLNFLQINSLLGIITGTIFLSEIPTGLLADRLGRKISLNLALLFQLLGEIFFFFAQSYFHFVLISIIAAAGFAFQSGCAETLLYDSLKEEGREKEIKQASGTIASFFQVGHLLGAFLSSFLISQIINSRIQLAIILTISSVSIAFVLTFFLKEPYGRYHHVEENPLNLLKKSLITFKNNKALKRVILLGIFTTPFVGYLRNFQPPYFQTAKIPPFWLGISLFIAGLLAIVVSKNAYKLEKRFGFKALLISTTMPGIFYLLMAFVVHPVLSIFFFIFNYASMNFQNPYFIEQYNKHLETDHRATALSVISMFSSFYIAAMGILLGWLADINLLETFLFVGVLIIFSSFSLRLKEENI